MDTLTQLYDEANRVARAIRPYGGNFMQQMVPLMEAADYENLIKIRDTWRTEWQRYLEMEELMTKEDL